MRSHHVPTVALAAALTLPGVAAGHDLWLEPTPFRTDGASASPIAVHIRVGEHLRGEPVPRDGSRILRFAALGAEGDIPVAGVDGADPAGWFRPPGPATAAAGATTWVLGYRSDRARIELPAVEFERYLRQEGLERIVGLRAAAGRSAAPGREAYSRCAKSLLAVGGGGGEAARSADDPVHVRRLGCPFEIVPEVDPHRLAPGAPMRVRLLFRGEPIAGVRVAALSRRRPGDLRSVRTDAGGRAAFHLDGDGLWLIKAVHMEAAPAGLDADWESWWASLTFLRASG